MRPTILLAVPLIALSAPGRLPAQTVERTDTPKRGALRLIFDPRILAWDRQFTGAGRESLGAPLSGDTIGGQHIPLMARLQQDLRTASGLPGFIASLGRGLLSVYQEKRITPITAELGVSDRLSLAVTIPIVRVATRSAFTLDSSGANLGPNPLATVLGADQRYLTFFSQFDGALAQLSDSLTTGTHYGCPASPKCAQAYAALSRGAAVRNALQRTVYGAGSTGSPFVPRAGSAVGLGIDSTVAQLQRQLDTAYGITRFSDSFLLATDSLTNPVFEAFLNDTSFGFGYNPFRNSWRYGLGDMEVEAKYRLVSGSSYALALGALARLPTGRRDSTLEVVDAPIADHQTDFEARVLQELTLARRVWLNLAIRVGTQTAGTRARRVAPFDAFLVPQQATTVLNWKPGDYAAVDFAPLYRFAPRFAAGVTAGYWTKQADHYSYRAPQDSLDLTARLGTPMSAGVLDQGTSERRVRLGVAFTYVGPAVEGGFTVEQTVSGAGGQVAAATVYRLVLRVSRQLF